MNTEIIIAVLLGANFLLSIAVYWIAKEHSHNRMVIEAMGNEILSLRAQFINNEEGDTTYEN